MGKCKFAESWLDMPDFKEWLQPVEGNNKEACCKMCKKRINIVSMGIKALRSHMSCASHKAAASRRERQLPIAAFCAPPPPSAVTLPTAATPEPNVTATTSGHSASSFSADIRVALGGTTTLRAEVLWCLHTAEKHHSLNSNENLADVFRAMFPDSDIAKTFACGKDKSGYIIRFGLAPYFKQELINTINKAGQFVLMFDESLNKSTKKKQLVHIRFWEDDRVQSRYPLFNTILYNLYTIFFFNLHAPVCVRACVEE